MIVGTSLLIAGAATLLVLGLWQSSSVLLSSSIAASLFAAIVLVIGARRAGYAAPDHRSAPRDDRRPGRRPPDPAGPPVEPVGSAHPGDDLAGPPAESMGSPAHRMGPPTDPVPSTELDLDTAPTIIIPVQGSPGRGVHSAQDGPPPGAAVTAAGVEDAALVAGSSMHGAAGHRAAQAEEFLDDEEPPDEPASQQVSPADAARVSRMLTEVLVVDGRPRYHLAGCVHLLARESEPLPVAEALELGFTPCGLCEPDSALLAEARRV